MISITETTENQRTVFRIDGQLTAEDVPVLEQRCRELGRPDVIDLSHLVSADASGSEKLRELAAAGTEIRGASPYVTLLISNND